MLKVNLDGYMIDVGCELHRLGRTLTSHRLLLARCVDCDREVESVA